MTDPSFEEVLQEWLNGFWAKETNFNSDMIHKIDSNDGLITPLTAQKIANWYRVSRTFPKFDPRSTQKHALEYELATNVLNENVQILDAGLPARYVEKCAEQIKRLSIPSTHPQIKIAQSMKGAPYTGGKVPISAVSKWSWFLRPQHGIIFDSYALTTLRRYGYDIAYDSYTEYICAFQDLLGKKRKSVNKAIQQYDIKQHRSLDEKKIFDLWLWYATEKRRIA